MKRILGIGAISLAVFVTGYAYASPYLAVNSIRNAAKEGNAKQLKKNIDFEAIRVDLKDQLKTVMMKQMAQEMANNPFGGLGMLMIGPMVDSIVDSTVSPAGFAAFFSEGKLVEPDASVDSISGQMQAERDNSSKVSMAYTSPNQFDIRVFQPDEKEKYVVFTMERQGLAHWMVNGVQFSQATFDN